MRSLLTSVTVVTLVLLLPGEAAASKSCPSRNEARAAHKGAYLYWHRNAEGQRCWSTRRASTARHAARRVAPTEPPKKPPPPFYPDILLFPPGFERLEPIPPETLRAQSIFDMIPWTSEAYAATPGQQVEPVPLPTPVNRDTKSDKQSRRSIFTVDAVMALVAFWLIIAMIGTTLYRWMRQRDALRIGGFVLALFVLSGCSRHVERFDKEPRSWTKTYEPGGKP